MSSTVWMHSASSNCSSMSPSSSGPSKSWAKCAGSEAAARRPGVRREHGGDAAVAEACGQEVDVAGEDHDGGVVGVGEMQLRAPVCESSEAAVSTCFDKDSRL